MTGVVNIVPWGDCTPGQQIERWVNVERVLEALPPHERKKHLDMRRWGYENDCGTIGCAAGLCSLDPWFRSQGWVGKFFPVPAHELRWWGPSYGNVQTQLALDNGTEGGANMIYHIRIFFGPTESEFDPRRIFLNDSPRSVEQVLTEVRERVAAMRRPDLEVPA